MNAGSHDIKKILAHYDNILKLFNNNKVYILFNFKPKVREFPFFCIHVP